MWKRFCFSNVVLSSLIGVSALGCAVDSPGSDDGENLGQTSQAFVANGGLAATPTVGWSPPLCIDLQGGVLTNAVWMWPCTGNVAQTWYHDPVTKELRLPGYFPNQCLTQWTNGIGLPPYQNAGIRVIACNGSGLQKWNKVPLPLGSPVPGQVAFVNVTSGLAIDTAGPPTQGVYLRTLTPTYGAQQNFYYCTTPGGC